MVIVHINSKITKNCNLVFFLLCAKPSWTECSFEDKYLTRRIVKIDWGRGPASKKVTN